MRRIKLGFDFDWQEWRSTQADVAAMEALPALRILFEIFLINAFERTVIRLKEDDCVNGPIHISIGQEAVAAASMAPLADGDKIRNIDSIRIDATATFLRPILSGG